MTREYLKDPAAIYRLSFARIREEVSLEDLPDSLRPIAVRMIHSCGMTDIVKDLVWDGDIAKAIAGALTDGKPILCDSRMVAEGIIRSHLKGNEVVCHIGDQKVAERSRAEATTRSAAAVELWRDRLRGSIAVIGNAPTALFRLIELIETGEQRPAAIVALPVGFVGAAESKEALVEAQLGIPFLTLRGRRGGSAMAAAVINAVAGQEP